MDIEQVKKDFISAVVFELSYANEEREVFCKKPHNIPWMISVLDEHLISDFKEFLLDIHERGYELNGFDNVCDEYTDAILNVLVYKKDYKSNTESNPDYYDKPYWCYYDYEYKIRFSTIFDSYLEYFKPLIEITKVVSLGSKEWSSGEDNLNKYINNYKQSLEA